MAKNTITLGSIHEFCLELSYHNPHAFPPEKEPLSHIHTQCEIYFNLSGDVSFMVEGHTYPISSGNVIISRPLEYHHCIYHNTLEHEHFCLLFSCAENEDILDLFFHREKGQNNLIVLSKDKAHALKKHFEALLAAKKSDSADSYYHFFCILNILKHNTASDKENAAKTLPHPLQTVLAMIDERYAEPITVSMLAAAIFVSVNTLERYFKRYLLMSPSEYIKIRRLTVAVTLLQSRTPISSVALQCGFSDTSNFIAAFKRYFGTTPYQYMKNNVSNPEE